MRYNPATDRALSIDEIAAQCRAAILKADERRYVEQVADRLYDEVLNLSRWENDLLIAA
jgi:anti-sigma-K factor RskA